MSDNFAVVQANSSSNASGTYAHMVAFSESPDWAVDFVVVEEEEEDVVHPVVDGEEDFDVHQEDSEAPPSLPDK